MLQQKLDEIEESTWQVNRQGGGLFLQKFINKSSKRILKMLSLTPVPELFLLHVDWDCQHQVWEVLWSWPVFCDEGCCNDVILTLANECQPTVTAQCSVLNYEKMIVLQDSFRSSTLWNFGDTQNRRFPCHFPCDKILRYDTIWTFSDLRSRLRWSTLEGVIGKKDECFFENLALCPSFSCLNHLFRICASFCCEEIALIVVVVWL